MNEQQAKSVLTGLLQDRHSATPTTTRPAHFTRYCSLSLTLPLFHTFTFSVHISLGMDKQGCMCAALCSIDSVYLPLHPIILNMSSDLATYINSDIKHTEYKGTEFAFLRDVG